MKILLLSSFPQDYFSYNRDLRSKIHREIKKELDVKHYIFIRRGTADKNFTKLDCNIIEMPFGWDHIFQKIAGIIYIFLYNLKIIRKNNADLIRFEMGARGVYDYSIFFYPLIFPKRKFYVETTTPSVHKSKIKRIATNFLMMLTLKTFKNIGVANLSTQRKFRIPDKKAHINNVGFPEYTFNIKSFQELSLVYLGTINNRDIWKTVVGFKLFLLKHPNVKMTYDIIGGGNIKYVAELEKSLIENSMPELIHYHGFQPVDFVNVIFQKCNVGIAFVPIVEYYDKVSTTKAVEYLLAGMPIIATRTSFSIGILKDDAGVLCDDTPEDFARALEEIYLNRDKFNSEKIREMYKHFAMSYAIKNSYIPMLKSLV